MSYWQILPLGPTGCGDSPYQSYSAFAANPLLISPDGLLAEGFITQEDQHAAMCGRSDRVDYDAVREGKTALLRKAYANFSADRPDYAAFARENAYWLDDYALYTALRGHFAQVRKHSKRADDYLCYYTRFSEMLSYEDIQGQYEGAVWTSWPQDIREREETAVTRYTRELAGEITYVKFEQYLFHSQWKRLHERARELGISIVGDMPIFVSMDSADVWAHPKLFDIGTCGVPNAVAGVPPDYFSSTGQLWGNPLYNWGQNELTDYVWWTQRMKKAFEDCDVLRIDHFRGFESYWRVPYGAETAIHGKWVPGPGAALFNAAERELGRLSIIAEDLGVITPEVTALRESLGYPGMAVLQFAFDSDAANTYLPHNYDTSAIVAYTGTHDNDTSRGWYESAPETTRDRFRRYLNVSGDDAAWDMIRLAFGSVASVAIVPLQDVCGLASHARMNTPGIASGNWHFRCTPEMLAPQWAEGLRYLAGIYNRLPARPDSEG